MELTRLLRLHALVSFVLAAALVLTFPLIFDPFWGSNDDIIRSMLAHGYGAFTSPAPNLFPTNTLWGRLVEALPSFAGVVGYTSATYVVLLLVGWALFYRLMENGTRRGLALVLVALVLARPLVYPQFSLNAGLLALSAIALLFSYEQSRRCRLLVMAGLLAFGGFLIRDQASLLVLAVGAPTLPLSRLLRDRRVLLTALLTAVAMTGAYAVDRHAYASGDWEAFRKEQGLIQAFTDYRAGATLSRSPDAVSTSRYTRNDLELLRSYFTADPALTAPDRLGAVLQSRESLTRARENFPLLLTSARAFGNIALAPLAFCGVVVLAAARRRRRIIVGWCIFMAAISAFAILGRPGITHVYYPSLALLTAIPFLRNGIDRLEYGAPACRRLVISVAIPLVLAANVGLLVRQHSEASEFARGAREDFRHLDPSPLYLAWGARFPYELIYTPLTQEAELRRIRLYSIAQFTRAPVANAFEQQPTGGGFVERLLSGLPIRFVYASPVYASTWPSQLLGTYCTEHHDKRLVVTPLDRSGMLFQDDVSCQP